MAEHPSALVAALGEALARERQLVRAYRHHLHSAGSPRVRQVLELGLALKRRHEAELERLLSAAGGSPSAEGTGVTALPGPREMLTWYYEREQVLALGYRDYLRLTDDPDCHQVVARLAADQIEHLAHLKSVYRGFSTA